MCTRGAGLPLSPIHSMVVWNCLKIPPCGFVVDRSKLDAPCGSWRFQCGDCLLAFDSGLPTRGVLRLLPETAPQAKRTVTVKYVAGQIWPSGYRIDWSNGAD